MRRALVLLAVAAIAIAAGVSTTGAEAKPAPPSPGQRLLNRLKAVTDAVHLESHILGENMQELALQCADAGLKRQDPHDKAEADAALAAASRLVSETIDRDFAPAFKGSGSDYSDLIRDIQALARTSSGPRRSQLVAGSLQLGRAQRDRLQELDGLRREIAAMRPPGYDCQNFDLQQHAFGGQRGGEGAEQDAVASVRFAFKLKAASPIQASKPQRFKVKATLTVAELANEVLPPDQCGELGGVTGNLTVTAEFPPLTVSPRALITNGISFAPTNITGSWQASGQYSPEAQCDIVRTFSCAGGFQPLGGDPMQSGLELDSTKGSLAEATVELPEIFESGDDSCPDGGEVLAYIPLPFVAHDLAKHAQSFTFPIDGTALRQHFQDLTIEKGIEHGGPPLPALDCTDRFTLATTCSTSGSHIHVVVTITPVQPAG